MVRRMRRGFAVGVVLALTGLAAPGFVSPAGAAVATITVTPSTGLVSGETVTVAGTGFAPGAEIGVVQCRAPVTDTSDCDLAQFTTGIAAADGSISIEFAVHLRIRVNFTDPVTCIDVPGECMLAAGTIANLTVGATFPISFDPAAPVPSPTLTVDPNTDLVHGQRVTVTGAGFPPASTVVMLECGPPPCSGTATNATADASGAFTASVIVRNRVPTGTVVTDCLVAVCSITAYAIENSDYAASSPRLAFDPDGPVPPPPTLSVTPTTGLEGGEVLQLVGAGFTPGAPIGFTLCAGGTVSLDTCDVSGAYLDTADENGSFTGVLTARLSITTTAGTIDCTASAGTCAVGAANLSDYSENAQAPLTFGPEPVPPDPPDHHHHGHHHHGHHHDHDRDHQDRDHHDRDDPGHDHRGDRDRCRRF